MTEPVLRSALYALMIVPFTLLPIINPLSGAPVFMTLTGGDPTLTQRLARQIAINCWFIIVGALLIGTYVLELFGISLPIVRIGGGLLVAASGWRMLQQGDQDEVRSAVARTQTEPPSEAEVFKRSFFPITFPLTTGPGTIAAAIALGASLPRQPARYVIGAVMAIAGAALTVSVVYLVYRYSAGLMRRLGEVGTLVMIRMMGFILLCIGIEIMWTGWAELNGIARP
ncbi:MarC family protein [Sphaerotilaceae bacterium SBD11-9]